MGAHLPPPIRQWLLTPMVGVCLTLPLTSSNRRRFCLMPAAVDLFRLIDIRLSRQQQVFHALTSVTSVCYHSTVQLPCNLIQTYATTLILLMHNKRPILYNGLLKQHYKNLSHCGFHLAGTP